jgi:5'-nucleotidase
MTLTRQDIKNVLEQQFAGCRGQTANRVMLPSAGFAYDFDFTAACDARIRNVRLNGEVLVDTAGAVIDPLRTHRVTVNNFMATGGDGFTALLNGTSLLGGAQDIDALVAYFEDFPAASPYDPANPALGKPRQTRLDAGTACP